MKACLFSVVLILCITAFCQSQSINQFIAERKSILPANDSNKRRITGCGASLGRKGDPMIIIDGLPTGLKKISSINPSQIETISILKADEAIQTYGIKGANGAILIATKKRSTGLLILDESDSLPVDKATVNFKIANRIEESSSNEKGFAAFPEITVSDTSIAIKVTCTGYHPIDQIIRLESKEKYRTVFMKRDFKAMDSIVIRSNSDVRRVRCSMLCCAGPGVKIKSESQETKNIHMIKLPMLWPNPAKSGSFIKVILPQLIDGYYKIVTSSGQLLRVTRITNRDGNTLQIETAGLHPGFHLLVFTELVTQQLFTQNFIIQ